MYPSSSQSLSASPNEFFPEEGVGDGPSPIPGTRLDAGAHNPCLVLGVAICQSAFLLLRALFQKEAPQHWGQERQQLTKCRGAGSADTWVLVPSFRRLRGYLCASLCLSLSPPPSNKLRRCHPSLGPLTFPFQHVGLATSFYGGKHDNHPHFTEEKTEAQRDAWRCHHWYELHLGLEPRSSDSVFSGSAILGGDGGLQSR